MFFRKLLLLEDTVLAWTDGAAVVVLGKGKKIKCAWGKSYVKLATHLLLFEVDLVVDASVIRGWPFNFNKVRT